MNQDNLARVVPLPAPSHPTPHPLRELPAGPRKAPPAPAAPATKTKAGSHIATMVIVVTLLAINLVGEGLNDALNPHLRRRTSP